MMEECDFIKEANYQGFPTVLDDTHNEDYGSAVREHCSGHRSSPWNASSVPLTDLESMVASDPERTDYGHEYLVCQPDQVRIFHADVHAGNLMVKDDGRVYRFRIVGRIKPDTWQAVLISTIMVGNFDGMADAVIRIGVTRRSVRVEDLSADLQKLYRQMDRMVPDVCPIR